MLSNHHLLSQVPLRGEAVLRRLTEEIWKDQIPLPVEATSARSGRVHLRDARRKKLRPVSERSCWGKLFDQRWCRIRFPRAVDGSQWLHWQDQGEATLYVNGHPFFGFDVAHRYCLLPKGLKEVWIDCHCVQSAIWHPAADGLTPDGSRFDGAWLTHRDDAVWNVYHDFKCIQELMLDLRQLGPSPQETLVTFCATQKSSFDLSPATKILLRGINDAADQLDLHGIEAARRCLARAYRHLRSERSLIQAVLTGHAHIDLVWLWPERIGEAKAVHTFATVNRLMDQYPEFRFAYSQPASYEAVQKREPELFKRVQKRMKSGQWQATGALYVESDTQIPCGEALFRSLLLGQDEFKKLRGEPASLTWLPDVFGYSACLPQLMKLAGVEYFFTTKMTWSLVNKFPYSSFVWKGNDGTGILAHVTQEAGYNSAATVPEFRKMSYGHQQVDIYPEFLMPTGYGDGGGGPDMEMCEAARRLSGLPGMPEITWDQPEAFFERLNRHRDRLPVLQGECYLESHRGTYTTHGKVKEAARRLERALQISEAAGSLAKRDWNRTHAWKRLIFSQFHDYIPGSSVWDVYEEGLPELEQLAVDEARKAREALSGKKAVPALFNPHAVRVKRWVVPEGKGKPVFVELPALSVSETASVTAEAPPGVKISGKTVSNGLSSFRLNKDGWLAELNLNGSKCPLSGPAGTLMVYPDRPANFEAWDIDRHTLALGKRCDGTPNISEITQPHRAGFEVTRPVGDKSSACVRFLLEAGSPLLHVEVDLDIQDQCILLKFLMPTEFSAPQARFGAAFTSVLRSQLLGGTESEAKWEVPFSRWLAVFDGQEADGLFAVTETKYGATVREGAIGVSLVRSAKQVGRDNHQHVWPPALARLKNVPTHTDRGRHRIRMAFGHYHSGLSRENHPASLSDTLYTDPLSVVGKTVSPRLEAMEGGDSLIPAWTQPLGDGAFLVRCHEVSGRRGAVKMTCAPGWGVAPCDPRGQGLQKPGRNKRISFEPYQVLSLRIEPT